MPGPAENPVARTHLATSKGMEPENEPRSCHHQLAVHTQEGTPEVRLQQKHNHAVKALDGRQVSERSRISSTPKAHGRFEHRKITAFSAAMHMPLSPDGT